MQFLLIVVISCIVGAGSLIYELVLFKVLALQLGTSHTALSMSLASFMAGLGLGTMLFGRYRSKHMPDRMLLAISLLVSGGLVILFGPLLTFADGLIVSFHISTLPEHMLIFVMTMVPTIFMGAVMPLLYRLAFGLTTGPGNVIGWIYGLNSFGAIAGVLLANFYLVPVFGLFGSSLVSALFFGASAVLLMLVRVRETGGVEQSAGQTHNEVGSDSSPRWSLVLLAGTAGFCGLALEIVWVRVLGTFLPNRHYSFGIVLAVYLLGYSLGSMWAGRLSGRRRRYERCVPALLILLGLFSIGIILTVQLVPDVMFNLRASMAASWRQMVLPPVIMSLMMVFPATFVMGMILPLLVSLYRVGASDAGKDVGNLFGANIGFSILGSLSAGFIILPALGAVRTSLIMGLIYVITGVTVLFSWNKSTTIAGRVFLLLAGGIFFVGLAGILKPDLLPKPLPVSVGRELGRDDKLLFFRETAAGTITVVEDGRTGIRWSYINNSAVCGTTYDALKVVRMLAHLPLLAHRGAENVLVIGFGLGVTAGNVLTYPVQRVDCVELCPEITEAAPLYGPFNHEVLEDKRLSVIPGDGRRWLKRTSSRYDVITCDPTHPVLGSGNLYTLEYFDLIKSRLNPAGVFVQYYPLRYLTSTELKQAMATFQAVFPNAYLWLGYSHGLMLGSIEPLLIDPQVWDQMLSENRARSDLMKSSLSRSLDWLAILLMGPAELEDFCGPAAPVSDRRPILEYPDFSSLHPLTWSENMAAVSKYRDVEIARKLLEHSSMDSAFNAMLDRFYQGQSLLIKGNIERARGNLDRALDLFGQARKTNWDDSEIRSVQQLLQKQLGEQRKKSYLGLE